MMHVVDNLLKVLIYVTGFISFLFFGIALSKVMISNNPGDYAAFILLAIPGTLVWFFYCGDRAVNERSAVRQHCNNMKIIETISTVNVNTHAWYRMTLRNPWKIYRIDNE